MLLRIAYIYIFLSVNLRQFTVGGEQRKTGKPSNSNRKHTETMAATKHPSWSRTRKSLKSTPQMICRVRAGAPDASFNVEVSEQTGLRSELLNAILNTKNLWCILF